MNMERRREQRLSGSLATFMLLAPSGTVPCRVANLSRLGLGIYLPETATGVFFDNIVKGSQLSGSLEIGNDALTADAVVRVRKTDFLGLEYVTGTGEFVGALRNLLSPQFVAESIYAIATEHLATDIKSAFRGDDFECIIFKPGAAHNSQMVQIFSEGRVVEVVNGNARFVPPPMVRPSARRGNVDFLSEFATLTQEGDNSALKGFFHWLQKIFAAWPDCPVELSSLVQTQLAHLK